MGRRAAPRRVADPRQHAGGRVRPKRGKVKVNPIAAWTQADVDAYISRWNVPVNELFKKGYTSIGCWPCTRRTKAGEDPRAGRWAMFEKTECGLHT
ncbi:hypothetical protein Phou_028850 [Phytohabitans houttuyneae]|uniref:Phosphoadenosine phosphosulphate reductase domain-containing protein n=1 Tax=Phytohabitans houttuyneae TaxID=1076126 RepID=A0A6V8KD96_9ACTN|nr:phosphoadenosine phosphosulfate reductase family protein [Phytohabitans houttuyneae]GFJ78705.1 hypothetical protein Phou_028850 [Phytohabitans houttuyneae]